MSSHRFAFWSAVCIVYIVLNWNIYGSKAATEYVLVVISTNSSGYIYHYGECEAKGARFGRDITSDDTVAGCVVAASPRDACDPLVPAPAQIVNDTFSIPYDCIGGFFAVAERGNCSFAQKAYRAQSSGYSGLIVYNTVNDPVEMASDAEYGPKVIVPAFMVGYDCGIALVERYSYENGYAFYIRAYWSYHDLLRYLVPFVAVVGVCFIVMVSAMVVKFVRDRRRKMRRRLSKKHLKQIPTRKFAAGDDPGTCPICLDDFEVGDQLRVLPCDHTYHSSCIDPWLLKNRRVCPICKRKVLPKQAGSSHSDSDTDETPTGGGAAGPSGIPSTPERTPLLSQDGRSVMVGNSTFYGMYETADGPIASNGVVENSPTTSSPIGSVHPIVLSAPSTPDGQSIPDDPTVDVDNRRTLLPQSSIHSSVDDCAQPGFVTASSSFREGYANPNFVVDAHEFDVEYGASGSSGDKRSDMV